MKNNKFSKITLLILSLALVLGAVFAMTVSADTEPKKPEIISQNVAYDGDFALLYAVDAEGITGSVTLKVYSEYPTDSTAHIWTGTKEASEYVAGNLNKNVYKFKTDGIAAANMCKQFYIQAEANGVKGDVLRYSVAEYLYERLATTGENAPDEDQALLYETVIAFGDQAQKVIGKISDSTQRIKNYRYVNVVGGKLDTYFTTGVYPIGTALNLKPDDGSLSAKWTVTPYTAGVAGTSLKNQTAVTVIDADRVAVEFGESVVITYPAGYKDFNAFTSSTAFYSSTVDGSIGGNNKSWVENVPGHGTVLSFTPAQDTSFLSVNLNTSSVANTAAKAYEMSFDMKLASLVTTTNEKDFIKVNVMLNYSTVFEIKFYTHTNGIADKNLVVEEYYSGKEKQETYEGISMSDWVNIRIVLYKGDANGYVYINGSDVPFVCETQRRSFESTWTEGTTTSLNGIRVLAPTLESVVYVDNVFTGYTMEEVPGTQTE